MHLPQRDNLPRFLFMNVRVESSLFPFLSFFLFKLNSIVHLIFPAGNGQGDRYALEQLADKRGRTHSAVRRPNPIRIPWQAWSFRLVQCSWFHPGTPVSVCGLFTQAPCTVSARSPSERAPPPGLPSKYDPGDGIINQCRAFMGTGAEE